MAGGSSLTAVVTADITSLQTKLAQAKAAYSASSADLRKFATDAQKAGQDITSSLNPAINNAAAKAAAATVEIRKLTAEMNNQTKVVNNVAQAHAKMGGVIGQNRVAFNELTHTTRAVADGLAAGINPLTLFSEEFFRVGQAITEFNTISVGTIATFGGIAAAAIAAGAAVFEYLEHLARLRAEADLGTRLQGLGSPIQTEQIHEMSTELRLAGHTIAEMGDNTSETRNKIIASFADIKFGGAAMTKALVEILPDFAHMFGEEAPAAVAHLTRDLNDLSGSGEKTMEALHLSTGELANFQKAASENPKQGMIIYLDTLKSRLDQTSSSIDNIRQQARGFKAAFDDLTSGVTIPAPGTNGFGDTTWQQRRQSQTVARNQQSSSDLQKGLAAVPDNIAPDQGAIASQLQIIAQKELMTRTSDQIVADQAAYVKKLLETTRMGGEQRVALTREYSDLEKQVTVATSSETAKTIEIDARKAAAAAGAVRKDEVEAELAVLRQGLTNVKLTADERKTLSEQIAQLEIRDVRASASEAKKTQEQQWQDYSATMRNAITDAQGNFDKQTAIAKEWVDHGKQLFGEHVHNYEDAISALNELDKKRTEAVRKAAEDQEAIQANMGEAQANLDKIGDKSGVGEFKPSLKLVFDEGSLDTKVNEQISRLRAVLDQQLKTLNAEIQDKLSLPVPDVKGASEAYKTLTSDMETFANQAKEINERAAQAVSESWAKITGPIGNAMEGVTMAFLKGGKDQRRAIDSALEGIVESYAKSGVKILAQYAADELKKLFITQAGAAAQQAAKAPSEALELASIAKQLSALVTGETAKTAAVTTAETAKVSAKTAGAAAGMAAQTASNLATISGDAAVAAAGAYASTASIPIVGPELAPAAAAEAYGAVMSLNVASAEGGWDNVPYDGAPAILHKNEMVLPANLAQGVRDMTKNGINIPAARTGSLSGTGGVINTSGDTNHSLTLSPTTNITAYGTQASPAELRRMASASHEELHSTAKAWYGNNSVGLPGKRTWGRK